MRWYSWKWWRVAYSSNHEGVVKEPDGAKWIHLMLGIWIMINSHECDRDLYICGRLAIVKCCICGAESIPWEVDAVKAKVYQERHPENMQKLLQAEKNGKAYWAHKK